MKERPIIMSAESVVAILAGHKTQTRRAMDPQPSDDFHPSPCKMYEPLVVDRNGEEAPGKEIFGCYDIYGADEGYKCPYGQIGDRLWVQETFAKTPPGGTLFKADYPGKVFESEVLEFATGETIPLIWHSPRYMPRARSRIILQIVSVQVKRLDDINLENLFAEGIPPIGGDDDGSGMYEYFAELWDSLNSKHGYPWESNPWVWVLEFQRSP